MTVYLLGLQHQHQLDHFGTCMGLPYTMFQILELVWWDWEIWWDWGIGAYYRKKYRNISGSEPIWHTFFDAFWGWKLSLWIRWFGIIFQLLLPFPSTPSSLIFPSRFAENLILYAAAMEAVCSVLLCDLGHHLSSSSESGRSPAAKRFCCICGLKMKSGSA